MENVQGNNSRPVELLVGMLADTARELAETASVLAMNAVPAGLLSDPAFGVPVSDPRGLPASDPAFGVPTSVPTAGVPASDPAFGVPASDPASVPASQPASVPVSDPAFGVPVSDPASVPSATKAQPSGVPVRFSETGLPAARILAPSAVPVARLAKPVASAVPTFAPTL